MAHPRVTGGVGVGVPADRIIRTINMLTPGEQADMDEHDKRVRAARVASMLPDDKHGPQCLTAPYLSLAACASPSYSPHVKDSVAGVA